MLNDLDAVDWSGLEHAYGAADDVPGLLRALAAGDREALSSLYGNIWHQGTVYEATGHAVPFLVRILDLQSADPGDVLGLLASIAEGSSYHAVHRPLLPRSRRDDDEVAGQMETELGWVAAAVRAVAAGTPVYLRLLATHPDETTRAAAAHLLGTLGTGHGIAEELLRAAAGDPAEPVRAAAVLSSYPFGVPVTGSLTDRAALPRLAAAIITLARSDADTEALEAIIERDAPACLHTVDRLPTGTANGLSWVADAVAPHWDVLTRLLTAWLRHPDATVREAAARAAEVPLHAWRPAAGALLPALTAAAQDPADAVRDPALRHLAAVGRGADLLWAAADRTPPAARPRGWFAEAGLPHIALTSLARLRDPRADTRLAELLRAGTPERNELGDAVDALGPWAVACREVILDAVEAAPAGHTRAWLIRAAGRIGVPVAGLVPMLRRQLAGHPRSAGTLLAGLGPAAAAALPELTDLRSGDDADDQLTAAYALWRITGGIDDLLGLLRIHLRKLWALELLAGVGPDAAGLAGMLPPMFEDDSEWRVIHAAVAYWRLTGDAEPVVPVLIRLVAPIPWGVLAVRTLADIGPAAPAAIPVLREHAASPYRQAGKIPEDDGWAAVCAHALARVRGSDPGPWPEVPVPEAFACP
ncbi:hypothetical protein AB0G04_37750 [Actinoplanes sp. NPDC023801]|uniref:hypothetical protein n=1 Tax=Actinoplanes sp. NPDC023801 TaxID=3154595 RepID=UPI0033F29DA1